MSDSAKDQSSVSANSKKSSSKLLRYPLRSASRSNEEKSPLTDSSNDSARGKPALSVSKSVSILHPSGKEKSAKPPRRVSVPPKPILSPASRPIGTITSISGTKAKRSAGNKGRCDTPHPNVSKSSNRRTYDLISSASYWLSQIKLSEATAKHSISLGFFKLALEAGSEPSQRLRNELKCYVQRHNLVELGEPVKQLFDSYNILQVFEELQVSGTCSHESKDGTRSSADEEVHSSSSVANTRALESKALNKVSTEAKQVKYPTKEKSSKIGSTPKAKTRNSLNKIAATATSASQKVGERTPTEKLQKSVKQGPNKDKVNRQGLRSTRGEDAVSSCSSERVHEDEDKENLDTPQTEVTST